MKGPDLWVFGAAGESGKPMWETDLTGGAAFVFGAEGRGLRPLVRRTCDELVSIPLAGHRRIAERERRRGRPALRSRQAANVPEPTLYLFDGFNLLHAGGFEDSREMTDKLASFVAEKGARGVLVFDGTGEDLTYGPLEVRFAEHADSLLERLAAEHRDQEQVCLVSSDSAVRGTSGQEVMKLLVGDFSRDFELETHREQKPMRVEDKLDPETLAKLEELSRGKGP